MKRAISILLSVVALSVCRAQQPAPAEPKPAGVNVDFKDGKQVLGTGFRVSPDGTTLLVTQPIEGGGTGEIGYTLALVDKVEFPDPPQVASAQEQLVQGKDAEALATIDPITVFYSPLRRVPGNWWLPAALIRLDALASLRREREVDTLLAEVAKVPNDPDAAEAAKLRAAEAQLRRNGTEKANTAFDELIKSSKDDDTLARAWLGKGRLHLDRREFEPALLAYLHVPVFYPDNRRQLFDALLGSGRAFVGLNNLDRAREAFQQIATAAPNTPQAAEAKTELQKIAAAKPTAPAPTP